MGKILGGCIAFLVAVLAIFRPRYDAHQKQMNDLIGDRNLVEQWNSNGR
jgi:hypothetical protein